MCTVTMILPPQQEYYESIRPLAESGQSGQADCFLGNEKLVLHNQGLYFLFSCQPRQLTLNAVSDYNPLIGSSFQPLERALRSVAMENVENLVIRRKKYQVKANTGNPLLKELRRNLNNAFFCNRYAVKSFYGPMSAQKIEEHHRQLISLAEQAIIAPEKIILITPETAILPRKTVLVIDHSGAAFKCQLSRSRLRIIQASPPRKFSIHHYRNSDIKITNHCLERFATRVLNLDRQENPIVVEGQLLKFIKNKTVLSSHLIGKTAILNISGVIFIGAQSRGKLNMVTTYRETRLEIEDFHREVLELLQEKPR